MIMKYYNGSIKKSILLEMTKTNKNGTTAYHIKDTLIKLGFEAEGVFCKLEDITTQNIILPTIANVIINDSYKHFIVIYEIDFKNKTLLVADPADKIKKISYIEFKKIYNNVLIIFFPVKSLPTYKKISPTKFIINFIAPHKKNIFKIFILSLIITIFSIITSFYTQYMIQGVNILSSKYLFNIFYIFFSIYIFKILLNFIRNKLLSFINQKINFELTVDIYNKIIKLPYHYYHNKTTGDIVSKINDLDNVRNMISKVALAVFVDLPLTLISLIVLLILNKLLFLISLIILILYLLIIYLYKEKINDSIIKIKYNNSYSNSYMIETIKGFETVKGIHIENDIISRFKKIYNKFIDSIISYEKKYLNQTLLKELINDIGYIIIILVGCILVIKSKISLGELFTFSSLVLYFLEPIKSIINLFFDIEESKISLNRVIELVDYENNTTLNQNFINGDIEFKNLSYSFDDIRYVLNNVNLKINMNSKIMVIGKSGSGKSTLFKLLLKYYSIDNNKILINNIDINKYSISEINNNILYIGQNEIIFNDTLYNNLIFDNSDSKKLIDICKLCYLENIYNSKLGFNLLLEESGFNLSGGERQRIVLARALLKNFEILIIDEGLSQVDVDMERDILKNIFKYYYDKTIIFISHRIDNLDLFDNLIEFNNNKLIVA